VEQGFYENFCFLQQFFVRMCAYPVLPTAQIIMETEKRSVSIAILAYIQFVELNVEKKSILSLLEYMERILVKGLRQKLANQRIYSQKI
jgi:hypothetical protein